MTLLPDFWKARHKAVRKDLENSKRSRLPCAEKDQLALGLYLEWIKTKWLKSEMVLARQEEKEKAS